MKNDGKIFDALKNLRLKNGTDGTDETNGTKVINLLFLWVNELITRVGSKERTRLRRSGTQRTMWLLLTALMSDRSA